MSWSCAHPTTSNHGSCIPSSCWSVPRSVNVHASCCRSAIRMRFSPGLQNRFSQQRTRLATRPTSLRPSSATRFGDCSRRRGWPSLPLAEWLRWLCLPRFCTRLSGYHPRLDSPRSLSAEPANLCRFVCQARRSSGGFCASGGGSTCRLDRPTSGDPVGWGIPLSRVIGPLGPDDDPDTPTKRARGHVPAARRSLT
jgi:hypothetical protein